MKLSHNMLRVISNAYRTNETVLFLNRVGLYYQTKDTEILQKAIAIASIINELVKKTKTKSEKQFYAFEINAEEFEKKIAKERKGTNVTTVKEILTAGGVVYEACLDYMYNHLTKYEPNTELPEGFAKSLDSTYNKLMLIEGQAKETLSEEEILQSIETIEELNEINSKLTQDLNSANSKIAALNSTVKAAKDKIQDMLLLERTPVEIDLTTKNLETLYAELEKGIREQKKTLLKNQSNAISNKLKDKIKEVDTRELEYKNIEETVALVDTLARKIEYLSNFKEFNNIVRKMYKLDDGLEAIYTDKIAMQDLLEGATDQLYQTMERYTRR